MRIDHVAHPIRDPYATHRFYTDVMGFELVQAYAGTKLLLLYSVPGGGSLAFSASPDRATTSQPKVLWEESHVGLTVSSRAELEHWLNRLKQFAIPHEVIDDERVYFSDPDGLVLELEVKCKAPKNPAALEILALWMRK
ncbi:MAG TPA: VOC family protein [Candidatus Angelobacter sp.]|nr:VOC family protein [Candidatus Angelobacter sp.]